MQTKAGNGLRDHTLLCQHNIVGALKEILLGVGVADQLGAVLRLLRSHPVSQSSSGLTAGSGRPIISNSRFATIFASGTGGCSRNQLDPSPPFSSLPNRAKTTVRCGLGPEPSTRASSKTAVVPEASSSAP